MSDGQILKTAKNILQQEAQALISQAQRLDDEFVALARAIIECGGNVVLTGVGKPLLIAQKISASMASTGTPSFTMHPVDALHGDLGRLRPDDIVIILSNSGESPEVVAFAKALDEFGVTRFAVTASADSTLSKACEHALRLVEFDEADSHGIAPTTSTTLMLALGDALTFAVAESRNWSVDGFAKFHPGGSLGRRLAKVEQLMRNLGQTAVVGRGDTVLDALKAITQKRCGAAFLVDNNGKFEAILTDGDVRRLMTTSSETLSQSVESVAIFDAKQTHPDLAVNEALEKMRAHQIDELPVVDEQGQLLGHLDVLDLV